MRDTRESGEMLEAALAAGRRRRPAATRCSAACCPRPARRCSCAATASTWPRSCPPRTTPTQDNGIKFFGPEGTKLDDDQEAEIERLLDEPAAGRMGRVRELHGAAGDYLRELEARFADLDLSGRRVLLDCANGATHRVAPEIFRRLGADVDAVAVEPDGRNINHGCGSTHVERLAARMDGPRRRLRLRRRRRPRAGGRPQRRPSSTATS